MSETPANSKAWFLFLFHSFSLADDKGFVNVGTNYDTSAFAVHSILSKSSTLFIFEFPQLVTIKIKRNNTDAACFKIFVFI